MYLSPHFSLDELTVSQTAARRGIDNTPGPRELEALKRLAAGLEKVRAILGGPILVSSGYRNPVVNRLVGGARSSDHQTGYAADIKCPRFGSPYRVCQELARHRAELGFDQLIHEYAAWAHISFAPRRRGELLSIFNGTGYLQGIVPPPR